jgi:P-type conjugative transfer protein TrbJ
MNILSRRCLLRSVALTAALVIAPGVRAQVSTIDIAAIQQAVKSYMQEAQSYATQLQQLRAQLLQYQNMLQNTKNLPTQSWGQVAQDITAVRNLSNAGNMLSGNTGTMLQRLSQTNGYNTQAGTIRDMNSQLNQWQNTSASSVSSLGRVLKMQQAQSASDAVMIEQIQQHGQTAQGQMQVLQASLEMSSAQAAQLARVQETLASTAAMTATQATIEADRRALYDASMMHFTQGTIDRTPGRNW